MAQIQVTLPPANAGNKLEGIMYYKGSHAIEDYLDEFQTLISEVSHTNPLYCL